jgi:SPP1 family predicted phage head-tail adaptor
MSIDRVGRAGKLNKRILIQEQVLVADTAGQVFVGTQAPQGIWTLVYECWANIEDTYGIEQKQSGKEVNEEWVVVQIRYAPSLLTLISPDMRVQNKRTGRYYDIRSVGTDIDGKRELIEMTCVLVR